MIILFLSTSFVRLSEGLNLTIKLVVRIWCSSSCFLMGKSTDRASANLVLISNPNLILFQSTEE